MGSKSTEPMMAKPAAATSPATQPPRTAAKTVAEVRRFLLEGRFRRAQRRAAEAAKEFPDHSEVRRLNQGLNEWSASTRASDEPDRTEEFDWLSDPPPSVRGKWVALVGREVVAAAETLSEVMRSLDSLKLPTIPLVHRVD